jgi:anaerobic ribonucleoside-triphosphate reductase activating protein
MRYNTIRQLDIANGPGCRVSLFIQGCDFNCPGCFNGVARDFKGGSKFTKQTKDAIFSLAEPAHISGLSILGGEPLHPRNRSEVLQFVGEFKEKFPNKTVWLWTGYEFEDVAEDLLNSAVDVIVDGRFIEEQKDLRLKYRGSSNQRVIDLKETACTGSVKLLNY